MKGFIRWFAFFSAAGLVFSLVIHILGLFGKTPPLGLFAFVLHFGVFVVGFGAVIAFLRLRRFEGKSFWKPALQACPRWMKWMPFFFFVYAIANFIIFWNKLSSLTGKTPDEITAIVFRGFSGHWLFVYSVTFVLFYSAKRATEQASND